MKIDTLMTHSISANTLYNAARHSMNTVQGHHHASSGVERYRDDNNVRWSMTVGSLLDPNSVAARYMQKSVMKLPILSTGLLLGGRNGNTLIISDAHLPYQHRDAFDWLWGLHCEYDFQQILNVGDLLDHHRGSYHESEPDAPDAETEYLLAKKYAHELQAMFPEMIITNGNHDNIPKRKLMSVGLPPSMVSDYNKLYDLEDTWTWVDKYKFCAQGAYPIVVPMVTNKRDRWDKDIMKVT